MKIATVSVALFACLVWGAGCEVSVMPATDEDASVESGAKPHKAHDDHDEDAGAPSIPQLIVPEKKGQDMKAPAASSGNAAGSPAPLCQ